MPLKVTEIEGKTYAEVDDKNRPVYTLEGGTEQGYDGEALFEQANKFQEEKDTRQTENDELKARLQPFEGMDPEETKKAVQTVKDLDTKKLIDAGEVEKVRIEVAQGVEAKFKPKLEEAQEQNKKLQSSLSIAMIDGGFARSKYIPEKMASPPGMVREMFRNRFEIRDGNVVGLTPEGSPISSLETPGKEAEFDEALQIMVEKSPYRDNLLKGAGGGGGSGAPGSGGGGGGGGQTITIAEFNKRQLADPIGTQKALAEGKIEVENPLAT